MTHTVFIFICLMAVIIVSVCSILHALYVIKKMREALKEAMKIIDSQNEVVNGANKIVEAFALKADALFVNSKMKDYNIVLDKLEAMSANDKVGEASLE